MFAKRVRAATTAMALIAGASAFAEEKTEVRIARSIYVGWKPWGYLGPSGIMGNWAQNSGIDVESVQINDDVESINRYTAGAFDGVSATNMDTLSIPSGGGVDTTALIVGAFSDGNDAVIVELSVSHYLLARSTASASPKPTSAASSTLPTPT